MWKFVESLDHRGCHWELFAAPGVTPTLTPLSQGFGFGQFEARMNNAFEHEALEFDAVDTGEVIEDAPAARQIRKRLRICPSQSFRDPQEHFSFPKREGQLGGVPQLDPLAVGQASLDGANDSGQREHVCGSRSPSLGDFFGTIRGIGANLRTCFCLAGSREFF